MKEQEVQAVVDIHTHAFNALCLPLEGIILQYLMEDAELAFMPDFMKTTCAEALATILNSLARSSEFVDEERSMKWVIEIERADDLEALIRMLITLVLKEFFEPSDKFKDISAHDMAKTDKFAQSLDWIVSNFSEEQESGAYLLLDSLENKVKNEDYDFSEERKSFAWAFERFLRKLFGKSTKGTRRLRFFCLLLGSEKSIVRQLIGSYSDNPQANALKTDVRLIVHLTMDMERAYHNLRPTTDPPELDFPDKQIKKTGYPLRSS